MVLVCFICSISKTLLKFDHLFFFPWFHLWQLIKVVLCVKQSNASKNFGSDLCNGHSVGHKVAQTDVFTCVTDTQLGTR